MWGIGPREEGYSKGGEAYWAEGAHLFMPLPYTSGDFFRRIRLHTFLTSGSLVRCCESILLLYTFKVNSLLHMTSTDTVLKITECSYSNIILLLAYQMCKH